MIINRELLIKRQFVYVDGFPEIPLPVRIHKWKKSQFLFT